MGDTNIKTKAAMLHELESIKGLLLEEDDIPILQEVIETQSHPTPAATSLPEAGLNAANAIPFEPILAREALTTNEDSITSEALNKSPERVLVEEQQDFFDSLKETEARHQTADELLNTIEELEKHTAEVTANKFSDGNRSGVRPSLAKATGENPFLPAHIRSRLHGNNPPPLFAQETARKIANSSVPSRQLGNTSVFSSLTKPSDAQHDLIDSVIEKLMPEIERELRARLEEMSKTLLDELNK